MQNKKVGVVIPIYNVAEYLRECLDSVINQTYKNLSIVLVNDGSTDNNESLNIAKEYVAKDSRFILIDKENGGLSSARNVGIAWFSEKYKAKLDSSINLESNIAPTTDSECQDKAKQNSNRCHVECREIFNIDSKQGLDSNSNSTVHTNIEGNLDSSVIQRNCITINHMNKNVGGGVTLYSYDITNENPYNIYKIYTASTHATQHTESIHNTSITHTINTTNNHNSTLQPQKIDYIIFLDSDDYWKPYCIEECIKHSDGVDIVWFDFLPFYENDSNKEWGATMQECFKFQEDVKLSGHEWLDCCIEKKINSFYFAWSGLIDFAFLKNIRLYFLKGVIHEDHNFGCLLFLQSENIYVLKDKLYLYRIRENSITNADPNLPVPHYAKHIYEAFSDKEMARQYHKKGSMLLMFFEFVEFLDKKPCNELRIRENFLPFYASYCESLVAFSHDPLDIITKMGAIEPYLKKKFKYRHKLRITNPAKYNRLKPLFNIYDSIKGIERTIRKVFKKEKDQNIS
ncbi:glycosyltransferase family 2 protein [Helicobacter bilis]|uniref:Glycosyltransferase family 2 protein n=1 Tax=Helicobacter bilis TaxID=37372 RepID=A0A4U8U6F7_9HELI|nr:glycosyltransferase family 2 protein [Helicobacter bilis]TLE08896.1 glycosyltransferase family 2 protein [Helicobacter bilis]